MPLVSKYWIAPVKPATPVVTILGKWSVERQALYFQRFTVATLFVQKLIETVPDGADELAEQLNQLAAFMADSMCLLHMGIAATWLFLHCMSWSCVLMHASTRILRCAPYPAP